MSGVPLTLALATALAGAALVTRRGGRNESDGDGEGLDEACRTLDYGLMQEGDDIGRRFDRHGGRGYSDTSVERAAKIRLDGLGAHPGATYGSGGIEGHEIDFWICAWARREAALALFSRAQRARMMEENQGIADDLSIHLRETLPDLKVLWFYASPDEGGISKFGGARCSFDLRKTVDWLATNSKDGPYLFGSDDMGWSLSWRGPPLPPKFLRWSKP